MGNKITTFDHTLDRALWCNMNCRKVWRHMKQLGPSSINKNIEMTEYILNNSKKSINVYVKGLHPSLWDLMDYKKVLGSMSKSEINNDSAMVTYI